MNNKDLISLSPDKIVEFAQRCLSYPIEVKAFTGLIISSKISLERVKKRLVEQFGLTDCETPLSPFDHTDYYNKEMGPHLMRCFIGFKRCIPPDLLAELKQITNRLEVEMGTFDGKRVYRLVNIDPGLLSLSNIILATTKNRSHRIYLGKGIYAEITLLYSRKKGWYPLEWTYPDYKTSQAIEFFDALRQKYYTDYKEILETVNRCENR